MERSKQAGDTFLDGKLEVIRVLGKGGMGTVYEVRHTLTKHRRALKVMRPEMTNATVLQRFRREASVAGTVESPYIAEIYDAGQLDDGGFYVLMEMLDGESLREYLGRTGRLESGPACALVEELCRGLQVAHEAGIIHRDLKPENVFLVDADGTTQLKLIDFGISKFDDAENLTGATETGAILGTPLYMSPEQLKSSRDVDVRTDLYAVGVMLYELLSGDRPFEADSLPTLLVKIYTGECVPLAERAPNVPAELCAIVERAMSLRADDRFASIDELGRAIEPFASELRLVPPGASTAPIAFMPTATDGHDIPRTQAGEITPRQNEQSERARTPVVAVAVILVAIAAAGLAWALTARTEPVVAPRPEVETTEPPGELPRGELTPIAEMIEMAPIEMQVQPDMQPTKVRMVRPSERDGLMRPGYGRSP